MKKIIIPVEILDKIERKHNVQEYEVYEVFENHPYIVWVEKGHRNDRDVYSAFGRTNADRYLIGFFIKKKNGYLLINPKCKKHDFVRTEKI